MDWTAGLQFKANTPRHRANQFQRPQLLHQQILKISPILTQTDEERHKQKTLSIPGAVRNKSWRIS